MTYYYVVLMSRTHAFLLERRMSGEGVRCELTYMPREIMIDLCNMGIKFSEKVLTPALGVIRRSGLPGCKVFKEILSPDDCQYVEVSL